MIKYKQVYLDYWNLTISDYIPCENCNTTAVDIHHLTFKSQGGKDEPINLMALCRDCHNRAHSDTIFNNYLKDIHEDNIEHRLSNAQ